jgi:4-carboxymuconolactone decarboxylase
MRNLIVVIALLLSINAFGQSKEESTERYEIGFKKMSEIDPEGAEKIAQILQAFSPDMGKYVVEYPYGDVFPRTILTDREKEIAIVAALTAMGNARPQLKYHLNAALNLEISEEKLKEIMILMSVYSGFPTALNGTFALKEVLDERKEK